MRLLAIDLGLKRTGIAVTDPLQIIASPLETVRTHDLVAYLTTYLAKEQVEALVIGLPRKENGEPSELYPRAMGLAKTCKKLFTAQAIYLEDERYTSRMAGRAILASGLGKQARQDKTLADKVAASLILQSFMERRRGPVPPQPFQIT